MSQTRDGFCEMLRRCVKGATEKRQTKTAVFYAEKLVTLSSTPEDVYIFAQVSGASDWIEGRFRSMDAYRRCMITMNIVGQWR